MHSSFNSTTNTPQHARRRAITSPAEALADCVARGFVTACAGAVLAVPVSDWAMQAHHVSSMEGGRACATMGIFAPLAFMVGSLAGFGLSLWLPGSGLIGYLKRQGVSLLVIVALVFAVGGIGWGTADHPQLYDGKSLALEIEVQVPTKNQTLEELKAADFHVALV